MKTYLKNNLVVLEAENLEESMILLQVTHAIEQKVTVVEEKKEVKPIKRRKNKKGKKAWTEDEENLVRFAMLEIKENKSDHKFFKKMMKDLTITLSRTKGAIAQKMRRIEEEDKPQLNLLETN